MIHFAKFSDLTIMFADSSGDDLGYNGFPVSLNYFSGLPDVSSLENSNLVVIFKSLMKKDSITKEKSLNDFSNIIDEELVKDENLIVSWLQMYPKLAIDNSRNVRMLAHSIQASILKNIGGKSFAKYLKTCLPVWLLGIYDPDKGVANAVYKGLLESFQNDSDRVNVKIWGIFKDSILKFIHTVICQELPESLSDSRYTKEEDSQAKYERVLGAAVSMLIKIISLIEKSEVAVELGDTSSEAVAKLLNLERLWDYLGSSLDKKTMNLQLFKSLLSLLKVTFSASSTFMTVIPDIKSLYKLTSKKFIKHIKLSPKSSIMYSSFILQFWDTIVTLTRFPSNSSLKIKKNFWELGGSKSMSRLTDYLRVGSCRLDPIYYTVLSHFFEAYTKVELSKDSDVRLLDLESIKDAKLVLLQILLPQLQSIPESYKRSCVDCIWKVLGLCSSEVQDNLAESTLISFAVLLRQASLEGIFSKVPTSIRETLSKELVNVGSNTLKAITSGSTDGKLDFIDQKYKLKDFVPSYTTLLSNAVKADIIGEDSLASFLQDLMNAIDNDGCDDRYAFETFVSAVKEALLVANGALKDKLTDFVQTIPSFVEPDFLDVPLDLLLYISSSNAPLFKGLKTFEAINDCFVKISMVDESKSTAVLSKVQKLSIDLSNFPDIYQYVVELTKRNDLSHEERSAVHGTMNDKSILESLLKNADFNDETSLAFIKQSTQNGHIETTIKSIKVDETNTKNLTRVLLYAWRTASEVDSSTFLKVAIASELNGLCQTTLHSVICDETQNSNYEVLAGIITNYGSGTFLDSVISTIESRFKKAAKNISIANLSMGNQLQHNALLFLGADTKNNVFELDSALLLYSKFVSVLIRNKKTSVLKIGLFLAEYVHDYFFLVSNGGPYSSRSEEYVDVRESLISAVLAICNFTYDSLLEYFNTGDSKEEVLCQLGTILDDDQQDLTFKFYAARSLGIILQNIINAQPLSVVDSAADIKFNQVLKNPYKSAVVLSSFKRFVHQSKKFDRVKNIVMSEILGVKDPSKAVSSGLVWLSLSNNFLEADGDEVGNVVPLHRLNMILGQISNWLESENAYDDSFIPLRCQIARFFTGLITIEPSVPDKLYELSCSLISDNMASASLEPLALHLRYFTLKLVKALLNVPTSEIHFDISSLTQDVLDLFLSQEVQQYDDVVSNVPTTLCHEQCFQLLSRSKITPATIGDRVDQIEQVFTKSSSLMFQRLAARMLLDYIIKSQSDFVVEYQLLRSKIGTETDENSKAKLPDYLINAVTISEPISLLDDAEPSDAFRYLWSWLLIFDHFRDITYSIRNDYVSQLRETNLVEKLLDSIFLTVDVSSSKISRILVTEGDTKKQKIDSSKNLLPKYEVAVGHGDSAREEIEFLALHLYYLCFTFIGSYIQNWYNGIRDRLLKQSVERFSVKFVSPLVIERILQLVINSKDSLSKDENTTVKVNAVSNEIKTVFNIDEQTMEMVIKVPESYPLSLVQVNGPMRLGVKENQWKAWLLASQRIISLVNGSITEAIELFIKNVDLHFSGFEECAICYSILHQDHSLPSKVCTTCLNKFHSACLYKWFKSSGASTCPLCRSAFNFRRQVAT